MTNTFPWNLPSLWDTLAAETRPIFLYGTGNGGDKIAAVCTARGIPLAGVFASDGFVRARTFHDMPVQSYQTVREAWGDDIVILAVFGTALPSVMDFFRLLDSRHTLYIPEVPLYGGALFDAETAADHRTEIEETAAFFAHDSASLALFYDAVAFRLTGNLRYLARTTDTAAAIAALLGNTGIRCALDGGAFRGDSASLFFSALPTLETVYAAEADPRTYRRLCDYAQAESRGRVVPLSLALWSQDTTLSYTSSASRGSGEGGKNHRAHTLTVPARTIDSLCREYGFVPDLLKLDVEGAEAAALDGAVDTLAGKNAPCVLLSLYHRTEDLWELPRRLHDALPNHRLYLRRPSCIPFWDLTLYAVRP